MRYKSILFNLLGKKTMHYIWYFFSVLWTSDSNTECSHIVIEILYIFQCIVHNLFDCKALNISHHSYLQPYLYNFTKNRKYLEFAWAKPDDHDLLHCLRMIQRASGPPKKARQSDLLYSLNASCHEFAYLDLEIVANLIIRYWKKIIHFSFFKILAVSFQV